MAGKINVPITTAIQGLANTTRQLNTLTNGIAKVGKTAGLAAIGYAAFAAGIKAADFAVQAIAGARDLERNMLGLKTVFEDMEPQMRAFSRNAEEVGLSLNEASKASVFIGSVLKQSGFSIEETADLTERLVRLGTDLSLTYGYDVQEALMGMTALFRGEYDPIEKFGVAMKQSEINSELAARGLDHLTGAARRFEEQQIRVELLFQRASDAQGAFQRGAGTLAVEQLKLQATFSNMRDTVANNLLPAIGLLTQKFREALVGIEPKIKESFEAIEPVLYDLGNILIPTLTDALEKTLTAFNNLIKVIEPIIDPTTELGTSVSRLIIQIESLFNTFANNQPATDTVNVFESLGKVLSFVIDIVTRLIYWIEYLNLRIRVFQERMVALFSLDWDSFLSDWDAYFERELTNLQLVKNLREGQNKYNYELNQTNLLRNKLRLTTNSGEENRFNRLRQQFAQEPRILPFDEEVGKETGKKFVKGFFDKLKEDVQKEVARQQLELRGASEGLIDAILGSDEWMKIWLSIKQGKVVLEDLQKQFNRTAAGAKELADQAKKSAEDIKEYEEAVKRINDELAETLKEIADKAEDAKRTFADLLSGFSILPTIQREIGQFEQEIVGQLFSIEQALKSAFDNKDILEGGYNQLRAFAQQELRLLASIGRQRDELAQRFDLAKGLIDNYKRAFTAALDLTSLFGQLKEETETRTVTSVSRALMRLGGSMREFEVTISSTYEETIGGIQNKSQSILTGFRDMAEKARTFGENLRRLRALGLDPALFQQLIDAGIDAGGATAQALVEGGSETINELNSLFKDIETIGGSLGEEVAVSLYGTGIDLANGLLEGIRSKQNELENQARTMAEAFNRAFQGALNVQVDIAAKAASDAAREVAQAQIDAIPVPEALKEPPKIDQAALTRIRELIAQASRYIANIGDATKRAGALVKRDIYTSLEQDILAGRAINLAGIQSGMTTAELAAAATAAGGTTVNNYYVNVTADTRTSGAKAGEAVVESLQKFGQVNGAFNVQVAV